MRDAGDSGPLGSLCQVVLQAPVQTDLTAEDREARAWEVTREMIERLSVCQREGEFFCRPTLLNRSQKKGFALTSVFPAASESDGCMSRRERMSS